MKVYLVGGAVRDALLGLSVKEKDYVVVGATVEEMLALKFRPVGKDFPVFLHPETKEEYALARTERKVGKGYKGFVFNASPDITLAEDLQRRDLTINAMAKEDDKLIDPYGGQKDIQNKILRHVSTAFSEDPVRILRLARFAARFTDLGFKVAAETIELMKQMVKAGEVDALVAERVWKEWERALSEKNPEIFFEVLKDCSAMEVLFPYPLDVKMLAKAAIKSSDTQVRFATLCHPLSEKELHELCVRYRIPSDYRDLALLVVRYQEDYRQGEKLDAESSSHLLSSVDAHRRKERFEKFRLVCEICFSKSSDWLQQRREVEGSATASAVIAIKDLGFSGEEVAKKIKEAKVKALEELLKQEKKK